jgi:hypothetical protein
MAGSFNRSRKGRRIRSPQKEIPAKAGIFPVFALTALGGPFAVPEGDRPIAFRGVFRHRIFQFHGPVPQ